MNRNKRTYQRCPLSPWNNGCCIFASHYEGTIRCFYGGETVISKAYWRAIEQPNIMCPKLQMWKDSVRRKQEYEAVKGLLIGMLTDERALTEGAEGTEFA